MAMEEVISICNLKCRRRVYTSLRSVRSTQSIAAGPAGLLNIGSSGDVASHGYLSAVRGVQASTDRIETVTASGRQFANPGTAL